MVIIGRLLGDWEIHRKREGGFFLLPTSVYSSRRQPRRCRSVYDCSARYQRWLFSFHVGTDLSVPQAVFPCIYSILDGKKIQQEDHIPPRAPRLWFPLFPSCTHVRIATKGPDEQESNRRRMYVWGCILLVASGVFFVTSL